MALTKRLRVYRYKRGDGREHFDEFEVPASAHMTVLDALRWTQLHQDSSLSLRHSCLHASCGTCGVKVDGREQLACICALSDCGDVITVEPLDNLPIMTDLVVDMGSFYERFPSAHPITRDSEMPARTEQADRQDAPMRLEDCIECGLCLSACPIAATACDYLGPAAMAAAERLLEEPRGTDPEDVLAWAGRDEGAWRCHVAMECTRVCPARALPAERIMALRRVMTLRGRRAKRRVASTRSRIDE